MRKLLSQDALARQADAAVHDYGLAAQLAANAHATDAGWDRRSPANGLAQNLVQVRYSSTHPPLLMAVCTIAFDLHGMVCCCCILLRCICWASAGQAA